jgi:hypothetical protein
MTSTFAGIKMLFNSLDKNVFAPSLYNFDSFSNVIVSSDLHP